jgi:hypothetical protein
MRNDKSNISEADRVTYFKKWVAFISSDWVEGETPVSTILAAGQSLETCNAQQAVLDAFASGAVVVNEFINHDPATEFP